MKHVTERTRKKKTKDNERSENESKGSLDDGFIEYEMCVYVFMHIGVSVAAYMCVHAYMCMSLLLYIAALTGWT